MINFFKKLFGGKPEVTAEAPYKVEAQVEAAPAAPAPTPVSEKATEAVVKSVAKPKKQGGQKKQGSKPKAPRKPKAPKA